MAAPISSQQDFYNLFINALQDEAPDLTDTNEGSDIDILAGVLSYAAAEIAATTQSEFRKTFIDSANGPTITKGPDDLQTLAVDHFGQAFARPGASNAIGTVIFSRANTGAGNIVIPAGTIVKTAPDANGVSHRYQTVLSTTITGTSINASIVALVAGSTENAAANTVTTIESTLLDSTITVNNSAAFSGGADTQDDPTYRETVRNLIESIRGGCLSAIQAIAKTVPGVVSATAIETLIAVKQWNIQSNSASGSYFYIPYPVLYIADVNGQASQALINLVRTAVNTIRSAGVQIQIIAASAVTVNWTAHVVLNPSGPNYTTFVNDLSLVTLTMQQYINNIAVGTGFSRSTAEAAILAIWGASGTNDLTTFSTTLPVADVSATATQKMIAGTMGTA